MKKKYNDILKQYPEYISKEQFYKLYNISKETAKYFLDSGIIPSINNGKKTRRYKIAMKDVIRFLEDRDANPRRYHLPRSVWSRIRQPVLPAKPEGYRGSLFTFYRENFAGYPDMLGVNEAAEMIKVTKDTILKWIHEERIVAIRRGRAFKVSKLNLLELLASGKY